jgi:hypothetical protein
MLAKVGIDLRIRADNTELRAVMEHGQSHGSRFGGTRIECAAGVDPRLYGTLEVRLESAAARETDGVPPPPPFNFVILQQGASHLIAVY